MSDAAAAQVPAGPLARLDQARRLLAQARTVDEVKLIRDQAEMMRTYAREREMGIEAQNHAAEIKVRAERRIGELLEPDRMERQPHARPKKRSQAATFSNVVPTLSDLGLTKSDSSRFQQIAKIPEPEFDEHIAEVKAADKELTSAGVLRLAAQHQVKQDVETADRILSAGMALDPTAETRYRQTHLRASFARAVSKVDDLVSLKPQAVVPVLDSKDLEVGHRLIRRFENWAGEFKAAASNQLRVVEDS